MYQWNDMTHYQRPGRMPSGSYRADTDRIRQRIQQAEKDSTVNKAKEDQIEISEEGRRALMEKMPAVKRTEDPQNIGKLSPVYNGSQKMLNEFESMLSGTDRLQGSFEKEEGTKTDTFERHVNQMVAAYEQMRERIEQKYASGDSETMTDTAKDGSTSTMTKEKELEMLDQAYETHSRFMAASTKIWEELKDFKVRSVRHSNGVEQGISADKKKQTGVQEQAYRAFMSAVSDENRTLLKQQTGSLNHVHLNLDITDSARKVLNGIWDYYGNLNNQIR